MGSELQSRPWQPTILGASAGIHPRDELEGMMAAQLIASHTAAMECYRRAMIGEQSFEGRRENLSQANKLSSGHRLGFTESYDRRPDGALLP